MTIKTTMLILMLWMALPMIIHAQEMNQRYTDPRLNKEVLCGYCNKAGLKTGEFEEHYHQYYKAYGPSAEVLSSLRKLHEGIEILIVLGTWCHDSHVQVPRFLKVLDRIKYKKAGLTMICVDRDKKACGVVVENLDIVRVPTFIVYRKGREIGRIIEKPYHTLEKDLLMFLSE